MELSFNSFFYAQYFGIVNILVRVIPELGSVALRSADFIGDPKIENVRQ